jgi:pimeloyl-ACP methyl ester carboxylesterase
MSLTQIALAAFALSIVAHIGFALLALRRNPPIGSFIRVDGVLLHYIERGIPDGPVLVLLHGNGVTMQDIIISGLADLAAKKYRVICFDRPGFGHSARPRWRLWTPWAQAALLAKALQQLAADRPIILGHSWAAAVAIAMGLEPTVRAKGLVLVSGYYFPTRRFDVWMLAGPAFPILGDAMRYTISPLVSWAIFPALLRVVFAPASVPQVFKDQFPQSLALRPVALRSASEESAFMVPAAASMAPLYPTLTCPVAIIAGDEDRIVEHDQARRLHAILPRSVLTTLPKAGHMLHHAEPERVLDAVALMNAWPAR